MGLQARKRPTGPNELSGIVMKPSLSINGVDVYRGALSSSVQAALVAAARQVAKVAPFFHPETKRGQQMSVRMTSAGAFGWISDRRGYRYDPTHPSGVPWPAIPDPMLAVWREFATVSKAPESCLINYYDANARMGLHQDRDEASFEWPVVSVSLGDDALFRVGTAEAPRPSQSLWLASGDVVVLRDHGRLAYHGVDRLRPGSSQLLPNGGRINLTLRVVT